MSIAENIAAVRSRIAAAAESAGRKPEEILLVGASKMNDAAACREAIAGGLDRPGGKPGPGAAGKGRPGGLRRRRPPLHRPICSATR